jgi:hypothetical protein
MSAHGPAGETIVRNLQQAMERLQIDIARVELWADALDCFTKPIPDYDHGQTRFDLPSARGPQGSQRSAAGHTKAAPRKT